MTKCSALAVIAFAVALSSMSASQGFARSANGGPGAPGGAGASTAGPSGNGGANNNDRNYYAPHVVTLTSPKACATQADQFGLYGLDRQSFIRLCQFDADAAFSQ